MDICLLWLSCVFRWRSLRQADHSSRGVLPTGVRRCVLSRNIKNRRSIYIYDISSLRVNDLTLTLLTWRKWWTPNNASKWQKRFNSAFKGLNLKMVRYLKCISIEMLLQKCKHRGLGANSASFYDYFIQYLSLCVIGTMWYTKIAKFYHAL
jgi:hypothetical protein